MDRTTALTRSLLPLLFRVLLLALIGLGSGPQQFAGPGLAKGSLLTTSPAAAPPALHAEVAVRFAARVAKEPTPGASGALLLRPAIGPQPRQSVEARPPMTRAPPLVAGRPLRPAAHGPPAVV